MNPQSTAHLVRVAVRQQKVCAHVGPGDARHLPLHAAGLAERPVEAAAPQQLRSDALADGGMSSHPRGARLTVLRLLDADELQYELALGRAVRAERVGADGDALLVPRDAQHASDARRTLAAHVQRWHVSDGLAAVREPHVAHVRALVAGAGSAHDHRLHKVVAAEIQQRCRVGHLPRVHRRYRLRG
eukprot:3675183-Prymnesium_polylepis.2